MKRFHCQCGQRVFFENTSCGVCQRSLGFDPISREMVAFDPTSSEVTSPAGEALSPCRNWTDHHICNWLVPIGDPTPYCAGCRLNATVPNLSAPGTLLLWKRLETAKRRMLYGVMGLNLGLPIKSNELKFHFLQDQRTNPWVVEPHVLTGYSAGEITINVAEADDVQRESSRLEFFENYRTLLGHFRHESGHFFWPRVVNTEEALSEFRQLFGDERADYPGALTAYHASGPPAGWEASFVSAYASAHPHEDWAESWAHYLHITDSIETAAANGMVWSPESDEWLKQWMDLSVALNEMNRSMGMADAYPFVLLQPVQEKLRFIHRRVEASRQNI